MKLNNLISYLFENMDEAALRGFSLDILKKETERLKEEIGEWNIEDISYRLSKLADKYNLPYMGRGSSRIAYALSTGKVLKISTGERGLAQTEAEVSIWTNPSTKEVAAQVFDFDPDYYWSVMEIAKTFKDPYRNYKGSLEQELGIPNAYGATFTIADIVNELLSDHFGKTADGRIVLIDYGYTEYVAEEFY